MNRALSTSERARVLQLDKQPAASAAAARVTITALDELIRDYPDTPELQRLRGSAAGNLALLHATNKRWQTAATLLEGAVADQREALRAKDGDVQAQRFLLDHLRMLCWCLRNTGDWLGLEAAALEVGGMQITPRWRATAAQDLRRCAAAAPTTPARADELREQAVVWLLSAARAGQAIDFDDPVFAAVRDDARIRELKE